MVSLLFVYCKGLLCGVHPGSLAQLALLVCCKEEDTNHVIRGGELWSHEVK